jgi:hypothetical protein
MHGNLTLQAIANFLAEHGNKLSVLIMLCDGGYTPTAIDFTLLLDALQNENCLLQKLRIRYYWYWHSNRERSNLQ